MNQLTLFGGTAEAVRPLRPSTAMLLAMESTHSMGAPLPAILAPKLASLPADAKRADTLRAMADSLQSAIDDKFRDRETNTPKRQRQAGEARNDGTQLERAQKIIRALAGHWQAGTVPTVLATVKTKRALLEHAREKIEYTGGYYESWRLTGKPRDQDAATLALWAMIDTTADPAARAKEGLRGKIEALQFAKIPGYFPTPEAVRQMMFERARLDDQSLTILEPSAGSGAIADDLRTRGFTVDCIEHWGSLREILTAKGHRLIHDDFTTFEGGQYDRILMNPPFEKKADLHHVLQAWGHLAPGGRLVAIMGAGVLFREDYREFRDQVGDKGGEIVELGAGLFKASGTGVSTVMVILDND